MAIVMIAVTLACGCSKQSAVHPGVRINDSQMYVSAKPIRRGTPVTFWFELEPTRKAALKEAIADRFGMPGLKSAPQGQEPVDQSTVEVTDAKVTRKVVVKQGGTILYQREETVTRENMEDLCSWTINSAKWADVKLTGHDIEFDVDYWRSYKSPYGNVGVAVIDNSVLIPVVE
jgi:hypothetical protein